MLTYNGIKLLYYSRLNPIYIQEVELVKVEGSIFRRGSFIINMEIDGKIRTIKTLPIFSISYLGALKIEDFSTKKSSCWLWSIKWYSSCIESIGLIKFGFLSIFVLNKKIIATDKVVKKLYFNKE